MTHTGQNQLARLHEMRRDPAWPRPFIGLVGSWWTNHNLYQGPYVYLLTRILFETDIIYIVYTLQKQANTSLCSHGMAKAQNGI